MRILHVGNGNQKHKAARYYDVGTKLTNGFIRNGHMVYFLSDRDSARGASRLGARRLGVKKANQIFLECCEHFKPDLIMLGHADIIHPVSLKQARQRDSALKIAQFNVDPIFRDHNIKQINSKLPYVDASFITTAGEALSRFSRSGTKVCFMPNPVDSSIESYRAFDEDNEHDVFWALRATSGSFKGDERIEIPLFLEQSGELSLDYHGMNGKAELFGADYHARMAKSAMALNISVVRTYGHTPVSSEAERYLYASDRISHITGNGLLVFTPIGNGLDELYAPDKHMIFYEGREELLDKLCYYKQHVNERRAIAKAGWQWAHEQFSVEKVTRYMIDTIFNERHDHDYAWPTTCY